MGNAVAAATDTAQAPASIPLSTASQPAATSATYPAQPPTTTTTTTLRPRRGCCGCARQERNACKDGKSRHNRKREFCTEQATEPDCITAGGRAWVGHGTCRWNCRNEL